MNFEKKNLKNYHRMLVSMKEDNKDPTAFGIKAQVNNKILFFNVSLSSSEFSNAAWNLKLLITFYANS